MPKRIIFVGHDAYRAGAQIALRQILTWLKTHYPVDLTLVLKSGGELLDDYQAVVDTHVFGSHVAASEGNRGASSGASILLSRIFRRIQTASSQARLELPLNSADLIYANSVASIDVLPALVDRYRCPVICHVHELEMTMRKYCGDDRFAQGKHLIDRYIAVSAAVEHNLVSRHGVARERIHRIYEAITVPDETVTSRARAGAAGTRARLGIPSDALVIGGCGTLDWRKAPDVFVQTAYQVSRSNPPSPVHFVWVGGPASGVQVDLLLHDVERLGIGDLVHFVGPQRDPLSYFTLFDAFFLSSREDPFPLVCLEAGALGVPVVCFDRAGGMPEFVEHDAGFVVPYLDVRQAADHILALAGRQELRAALGARAAEKARTRHDISVVGRQIAAVLDRYLSLDSTEGRRGCVTDGGDALERRHRR